MPDEAEVKQAAERDCGVCRTRRAPWWHQARPQLSGNIESDEA